MVRIANPIYDSVFKRLMENHEVAAGLISCLLKVEVKNLQLRPQEVTDVVLSGKDFEGGRLRVFRLDFSANITLPDGSTKRVLVEIQKAGSNETLARFRSYLANAYRSSEKDGEPLPIVAIYFLGFNANADKPPVMRGRNSLEDVVTASAVPADVDPQKDAFFNALVHDAIFIQIPGLEKLTGDSEVELALRLFNQSFIQGNRHFLSIAAEDIDAGPAWVRQAFRILQSVASDTVTQTHMDVEDEVTRMQEAAELKLQDALRVAREQAKQLHEERRLREEADATSEAMRREMEEMRQRLK
jgi:hypothetical protein